MKIILAFLLFFGGPVSSAYAGMTGWTEIKGGAVRLISSGLMENGQYRLGLEFSLETGWHTYWRYPGEAGIPPLITLDASHNVKDFEVLYPAPERYDDGFSQSIVYHDGIVLPINVTPANGKEQVMFSIQVLFGICREICVPGEALLELPLGPDKKLDALAERLIDRDLAAVPVPQSDGGPRITSITSDGDYLLIETYSDSQDRSDLFAEGPEGSFISLPKLADVSGNTASWRLSKKGLLVSGPEDVLRLVLVDPAGAVYHLEPLSGHSIN